MQFRFVPKSNVSSASEAHASNAPEMHTSHAPSTLSQTVHSSTQQSNSTQSSQNETKNQKLSSAQSGLAIEEAARTAARTAAIHALRSQSIGSTGTHSRNLNAPVHGSSSQNPYVPGVHALSSKGSSAISDQASGQQNRLLTDQQYLEKFQAQYRSNAQLYYSSLARARSGSTGAPSTMPQTVSIQQLSALSQYLSGSASQSTRASPSLSTAMLPPSPAISTQHPPAVSQSLPGTASRSTPANIAPSPPLPLAALPSAETISPSNSFFSALSSQRSVVLPTPMVIFKRMTRNPIGLQWIDAHVYKDGTRAHTRI